MTTLPSVTLLRVDFAPVALPPLSGILDELVPNRARARLARGPQHAEFYEAVEGKVDSSEEALEGALTVLGVGGDRTTLEVRLESLEMESAASFALATPLALEAQPAWLQRALEQRARPRVVLPQEEELRACVLVPDSTQLVFGRVTDASALGLGMCLEEPVAGLETGTRLRVSLFFGPDAPPSPCFATVAHTHERQGQQLLGLQLHFRQREYLSTYHALRAFLQARIG